jgi:hypothetical protein
VWVTEGATKGASEQGYRVLIPECTKVSQSKGEKKGESKTHNVDQFIVGVIFIWIELLCPLRNRSD